MSIFIIEIGVYGISEMKKMNRITQSLYADCVVPLQQLTRIRFSYTVGILSSAEQVQNSLVDLILHNFQALPRL
jgi:Four helix bundle sensory module for signal transduction